MAFGALRKAYSAPCKFHADEVAGANRIRWYKVPDDRQVYDGLTVFTPQVDTDTKTIGGPFEKQGPGRFVRRFEPGFDYDHFPGLGVDGDAQDFLGKSPLAKHFIDDELIAPLDCVGIECLRAGLALGGEMNEGPYHADLALAADEYFAAFWSAIPAFMGRMFAGKWVIRTSEDFGAHPAFFPIKEGETYRVDLIFDTDHAWAWALAVGDDYGTSTPIAGENPETKHRVYFEFEAAADGFAFLVVQQLVSTFGEFRAVYWEEPFPPETYDAGLGLGAVVADPPYPFGSEAAGLALRAVDSSADSDYTLAAGLSLGAVEADGTPPLEPGVDCDSAGDLPRNEPFEFSISEGEEHWFRVDGTDAADTLLEVSGLPEPFCYVRFYRGDDCGSKSLVSTQFSFPAVQTIPTSDYSFYWVRIINDEGGPYEYTVEWRDD